MIITRPILQRLSPAIREAAPEVSDNTLNVPSLFSFVGLPGEPIRRPITAGGTHTSSVMQQHNAEVSNGAQNIVMFLVLTNGWWRIRIQGSYVSNYALITGVPGNFRIILANSTSNIQVVTKFAQAVGAQPIDFQEDFVFAEPDNVTQLTAVLDANGAAQDHLYSLSIICQRLL